MRMNKRVLSVGISMFSTLILGNMVTQQAKADTSNQTQNESVATNNDDASKRYSNISSDAVPSGNNSSNVSSSSNSSNDTQTNNFQTPTAINNDLAVPDNNLEKTDSQMVNITFTDQNNNQVVNSQGTPYTYSGAYDVGSTVDYSDLASKVSTDLNGGYTLNDGQDPITVKDSDNNYTLNVTAKTYNNIAVQLFDPNGNSNSTITKNPATVGQKSAVLNFVDPVTHQGTPLKDAVFNGYGYSHLAFRNFQAIPNTNSDGTITITYDLIPELEKTMDINNFYVLKGIVDVPLDQSLTIQHADDQGVQIPGSTDETITGYKTGDVIDDPYSLATVKNLEGYTYIRTTQPYTVSDNNVIKLIYTIDSLNYLKVNYINTDTGKTVYTDDLRGNSGNSVTIKDIANIPGFDKYKMTDDSVVGEYTIKSDNESLNVDVTEKDPLALTLNQSTDGGATFTTTVLTGFGDPLDYDKFIYLSNDISDIKNIDISTNGTPIVSYTQDDLQQLIDDGAELSSPSDLMKALFGDGNVEDDNSGLHHQVNITYANISNKTTNISYQTADGTVISTKTLTNNSPDNDIGTSVTANLPADYELVDSSTPYTIGSVTDNSIELISQIKKISDSNNSGGPGNGSGGNSGGSQNNSDNITSVKETLSSHPNLSNAKVYDDSGNFTDITITPNSDWFTDQKMELNGETYYRIATNQWVNANDVYIYYNDTTFIKTHSDSAKNLVNSQNKAVSDRKLSANSDWATDRYAYINEQKYYRVATNEWIKASDGLEYQPTDAIVQPSTNAKLFDEQGNFVTNAPTVRLKTDKISTINGVKMYRVASNEWLPITDVQ